MSLPSLDDFVGMSVDTGARISGEDHLRQSLRLLITTPKGSRVMRRLVGSDVPFSIDAPMNQGVVADIVATVAEAIIDWEPRLLLRRVIVRTVAAGRLALDLVYDLNGKTVLLQDVL